ncbi:hypothetical protein LCGC14_0370670 [marine sediment metagenome]|uniref:Uncharacterized protein n=3 Tax=root TaxID=1 RepID=A0A0F9VSE9_9ZZZZ
MVYSQFDEIPLFNWFKLIDKGDAKYLFKDKPVKVDVMTIWMGLQDQYFDMMGISDEFTRIWKIKGAIMIDRIDMALTGNLFLNNRIRIKERELKGFQIDTKPQRNKEMAQVAKYQNVSFIDPRKIKAAAYYGIIQNINSHGDN